MIKKIIPYLCGILAPLIWGGWLPVTKLSVSYSLTPMDVIFLRFGTAFIIGIPFFFRHGVLLHQAHAFSKIALLLLGSGVGYVAITIIGFKLTPASYSSIIPISVIFFSVIIKLVVDKQKISIKIMSTLVLITVGFLLFAREINIQLSLESALLKGILLFLLGGFFFASYNAGVRKWSLSGMQCFILINFYSFLLFLPFYLWVGFENLFKANPIEIVIQALYQGILVSFIGLILFVKAILSLGSAKASLFIILVPISGTILSVIFLGDQLSALTIISMLIMLLGSFVGLLPDDSKKKGIHNALK